MQYLEQKANGLELPPKYNNPFTNLSKSLIKAFFLVSFWSKLLHCYDDHFPD